MVKKTKKVVKAVKAKKKTKTKKSPAKKKTLPLAQPEGPKLPSIPGMPNLTEILLVFPDALKLTKLTSKEIIKILQSKKTSIGQKLEVINKVIKVQEYHLKLATTMFRLDEAGITDGETIRRISLPLQGPGLK